MNGKYALSLHVDNAENAITQRFMSAPRGHINGAVDGGAGGGGICISRHGGHGGKIGGSCGESIKASLPQTRSNIECEAIGGVWSPHPPPTTNGKLRCLGGGDKRPKGIAGLRKRWDGAIFKAECLN